MPFSRNTALLAGSVLLLALKLLVRSKNESWSLGASRGEKFTLLTPSYEPRLPALRSFIAYHSKCSSVAELVVVWGSRQLPPDLAREFTESPVRIRVRWEEPSLNRRFKPDPLITTRAVLQLDDDLIIWCSDLNRAFAAWRSDPAKIVGFFPRWVYTQPKAKYQPNIFAGDAGEMGQYNAVLTKGAFLDARQAFAAYWSEGNAKGRALVDQWSNCEDLLMNYVWARHIRTGLAGSSSRGGSSGSGGGCTASSSSRSRAASSVSSSGSDRMGDPSVLRFMRPRCVLDTAALSGVGISGSNNHIAKRRACVERFAALVGSPPRSEAAEPAGSDGGKPWSYSLHPDQDAGTPAEQLFERCPFP